MKDWRPIDIVALILAFSVAFVLIWPAVDPTPLTGEQLDVYRDVISATIALLGVYIGNVLK